MCYIQNADIFGIPFALWFGKFERNNELRFNIKF
jgi:hypothetical protein